MASSVVRESRAAVAAILMVGTALVGCGDLSPGELERRIAALESAAAEGAMLARQVADDRTKTTFARVRSRELSEDVDHEAEKMADATPAPGQAGRRDRAVALADRIAAALGTVQVHPEDERLAAEAEADLEGLAESLSNLMDGR